MSDDAIARAASEVSEAVLKLCTLLTKQAVRPDGLITAKETVAMLGTRRDAVYDALKSGDLPAVRIGNEWRVHPDDALQWHRKRSMT
ncbi:MAG: helix-turn-helix domain-containing protein [bacterium]